MIRKSVKEQLLKCNFANLNNFDEETGTGLIPKYSKPVYELNKCYLIQLPKVLVNNADTVIATNWNNGTSPKANILKIFVSKMLGKMIYVDSLVYNLETKQDLNIFWSGWLPIDEITQLAAI